MTDIRYNSRLKQGGQAEIINGKMSYWDRRTFAVDVTDEIFNLTVEYERRPDLLAYDKYNDSTLMWFVLQYNAILDINTEFVTGRSMRLPTPHRLRLALLSRTT